MENRYDNKPTISLEDAKAKLISFGNQIQEYLDSVDANIEKYKFSIEKADGGIAVDVAFKAMVKGKETYKLYSDQKL
jgi:hypothetical protein